MRVIVPFDPRNPKTRLSEVLSPPQRRSFARVMLRDVLDTLHSAGHDPTVLATEPVDGPSDVVVDERSLNDAVNGLLADSERPVAIVMADLPLATPAAVDRLVSRRSDIVVAPGRGGGTNALVVRHPDFRVDYHGVSYRDHCEAAAAVGADVTTVDSYRLAVDIDEQSDLVEVLLHGSGAASEWLRDAGFALEQTDGRTRAVRTPDPVPE